MTAYYNEFDPYVAEWLRHLIAAGHIPAGEVDQRDIRDVSAADLRRFDQCHFFAGIGGWPLALRLAGWPDDRPVWTGSCPCQPFSAAGKRKGTADERHLWPEFFRLIAECRPATVFGEQVASKDGRQWLAGVRADLEGVAYAVGAADLCSAGVGAPHIRQRLWWMADVLGAGLEGCDEGEVGYKRASFERSGSIGGLANTEHPLGRPQHRSLENEHHREDAGREETHSLAGARGTVRDSFWSAYDIVPCADGKARRVEPGTFPLAHGVPARVGKLRAYGNAIVPQVAAEFVQAYEEARFFA